jgi:hypothetical protein
MKTAAENEVGVAVSMTTNKRVKIQLRLSNTEAEATSWSEIHTDRIPNQLEKDFLFHFERSDEFQEGILHPLGQV